MFSLTIWKDFRDINNLLDSQYYEIYMTVVLGMVSVQSGSAFYFCVFWGEPSVLPDIHTGYRDILHLRGRIVGAYKVVSAMLPDIHTGYRNI